MERKNKANLMKTLKTSDKYTTLSGMKAAKPLFAGADAMIWTSPTTSNATSKQICNAIWGTCGRATPLYPVAAPLLAAQSYRADSLERFG